MATPLYPQGGSSGSHVIRVAELALMICSFSNKSDYINLLYLCRDTYAIILPLVWEEVDLYSILLLIPELNFDDDNPESLEFYR
ncbi:hypothetical protein FRC12_002493, partial [Ceratobasidium sp. 428]